jgi:hypothetical protein
LAGGTQASSIQQVSRGYGPVPSKYGFPSQMKCSKTGYKIFRDQNASEIKLFGRSSYLFEKIVCSSEAIQLILACELVLSRYSYQVGHKLVNGSYDWGRESFFKAAPYPGEDSLQRVIIYGDMGKVCRLSSS